MDASLINLVLNGGALGTMLVFIIGLVRNLWMMRKHHDDVMVAMKEVLKEVREDRDEWRSIAREATAANVHASRVAAQAATVATAVLPGVKA